MSDSTLDACISDLDASHKRIAKLEAALKAADEVVECNDVLSIESVCDYIDHHYHCRCIIDNYHKLRAEVGE